MPGGKIEASNFDGADAEELQPEGRQPLYIEQYHTGSPGSVARRPAGGERPMTSHGRRHARSVKRIGMVSVTTVSSHDDAEPPKAEAGSFSVLKATLDNMHQGLLVLDRELRISAFNERVDQLIGFPPGVIRIGATVYDIIASAYALGHYGSLPLHDVCHLWLERLEKRHVGQHRAELADGRVVSIAYVPIDDGGWAITYEDISERIEAARTVATQNERFDAALSNMPHGLCMFDGSKRLILCNPAYARLYALPEDLVRPGTPLDQILAHRARLGNSPVDMGTYFDVVIEAKEKKEFASRRIALLDGRTIQITHNPMPHGAYVATHEDITATIKAEAEIRYLAAHDALTGLPNRTSLREKLSAALARVRRNEKLAVHCLDLDEFKIVNDTLGHPIGDLLLKAVAERLARCVREVDTVARLGGDEFVVLQVDLERPEEAGLLARRLVEAMTAPFNVDGHHINVGVSVGIAFCPNDGIEADEVLKKADIALYRAKADGRNTFRFFELAMDRPLQARRRLELDLRVALAAGDFRLHYQPLVDAQTSTVKGFEALLRWTHPERGPLSPLDFIPLAEETGLIVPIGEWVVRRACRDAALWPHDIRVAVNLSPLQFKDGNLTEIVFSALANAGLPASRLELEITESVLLIDSEATLQTLHQLRSLGIRIALDDFGTGYSSLSYLRSFPFDKIKIDKSFVRDLAEIGDCMAIVKAVAGLGSALGMSTTAEGVETEEQLRHVREQGCTEVQGFYFSVPRPAEEIAALLDTLARRRRSAA